MTRSFFAALCAAATWLSLPGPTAADVGSEPLVLTERLGLEIDSDECGRYHLLPGVEGFRTGTFYRSGPRAVRLRYEIARGERTESLSLTIHREEWELLQKHARLVEAYHDARASSSTLTEVQALERLALRYAARGRYDIARDAMSELAEDYPSDPVTRASEASRLDIERLAALDRALFLPGSLHDQSGRTDLLVFSGYYGLFTGIATPVAFNADGAKEISAGLLVAVPLAIGGTALLTRNAEVSKGRADMIAMAGQFGTWQGLGWAAAPEGDDDDEDVLKAGLLTGVGSIALGALLTHGQEITEGHGAISSFAWTWGAWFGLVGAQLGNADGNEVLTPMLIASDAALVTALIGARGARMSRARVRLVSLLGVAGGAFGLGLHVLGDTADEERGFGFAGAGSLAGLALGAWLTRAYDRNRDVGGLIPELGLYVAGSHARAGEGSPLAQHPAMGLRWTFR